MAAELSERTMDLIPQPDEVRELLLRTGALQSGHFIHRNGTHADACLQLAMALRHYSESKMLCVGLSRLLRGHDEVRRHLPNISIVAPATGGLPVAFGVAEALRAAQTYWAEEENGVLQFRQFMGEHHGEKVVLVDDMLRSGRKMTELRQRVEAAGASVLAIGVLVHQLFANPRDFGALPIFHLVQLEPHYWSEADCPLCRQGVPTVRLRM